MNPAVTLGVLLAGGINIVAAVCYFFAQVLGGITGAACVLVSPCIEVVQKSSSALYSKSFVCPSANDLQSHSFAVVSGRCGWS